MGVELFFDGGGASVGGPSSHGIQLRAGDATYMLRLTAWGWGPSRQCEVRFLGYHIGESWASFTHIPYEEDAFAWAAQQSLLASATTQIVVVIDDQEHLVDRKQLRQVDTAKMVGPVWCPVANMRAERPYGPGGRETKRGSKHFAPGAKLYCFPVMWGDGYDQIQVVGRHRASHRYVKMIVSSSWLINWRVQLVYSPHVIRELWPHWSGATPAKESAQQVVEAMKRSEALA